ncbi:MAG TPA: hypothetical protein VM490_15020 [Armatimonadaceae bacterium]|jgi:hypothetical protein|nr:hypothetical protein [Armatimonadaceae bacterium]
MEDEEILIDWYPYENGATVGKTGPGGGTVRRDEELGAPDDPDYADARLTLEQGSVGGEKPFTVTAVIYGGWLLHTVAFATREEADGAFDALQPELEELSDLIPDESDRDIPAGVRALNAAIADFQRRFPS